MGKKFLAHFTDRKFWKIILTFATAMGAFGGFPDPPKIFQWFTKWKIFQWFTIFVLIYQGGADGDAQLAVMITLTVFAIYWLLHFLSKFISTAKTVPILDTANKYK